MYCLSKCCRLCLTKNNTLVNIKWSGSDGLSFLNKLGLLAPSLVTNPRNYMSWICEQCRQKLKKAYRFIQNCFKSDAVLEQYCMQLINADTVQNKCIDSYVSDIQLTENIIKESIPISVKEEYFEDLPAIDDIDNQYYLENTITIDEHKLSHLDFEYIKVDSSDLKQEVDLNVGHDPISNFQQIDPIAGTSGENNILSCSDKKPPKKRLYKCDICDKTFSRSSSLKDHERFHSGERPYNCKICDKKFKHSRDIKRHERIHTGERRYECKICNVKFSDSGNLKKHERIHSGERPFKCKICDKKFKFSGDLKQHNRVHSGERPYDCKMCDKKFKHISDQRRHEKLHSGERPYACKICNKQFADPRNLKRHERIHCGERPFKCKICNKTFSLNGTLKCHEALHSRDCS